MPTLTLQRPATCADCGQPLPAGSRAASDDPGRVYGRGCHQKPERAPAAPESPTGAPGGPLDAWLRALPVNVPTALTDAKNAPSTVANAAIHQGFWVRVHIIDGTIWVLRLPGGRS